MEPVLCFTNDISHMSGASPHQALRVRIGVYFGACMRRANYKAGARVKVAVEVMIGSRVMSSVISNVTHPR